MWLVAVLHDRWLVFYLYPYSSIAQAFNFILENPLKIVLCVLKCDNLIEIQACQI